MSLLDLPFLPALIVLFGIFVLGEARHGRHFGLMSILLGGTCLWLLNAEIHTGFVSGNGWLRASVLFGATSPLLGWIWWGRSGIIRRHLIKAVLFLSLTAVCFILWSAVLGTGGSSFLLALVTAALPFLGFRRRFQRLGWRWRSWRQGREEDRRERLQLRQEQARLDDHEQVVQRSRKLEATLAAKDQKIAALESLQTEQHTNRARQREEIAKQVRLLRHAEIQRVREDSGRLRFHPHYGFLMAEAWRVLRGQIARGERIPAAEHDAFFFQVITELLQVDDFERRYFHEQGRKAIDAVNRYLDGGIGRRNVLDTLGRLDLEPTRLAPEPLSDYSGGPLFEAWLVPHRRFQHRLWEDFQTGRHPQQQGLITFLQNRKQGLPSSEEWRSLWDDHPALFSGVSPIWTVTQIDSVGEATKNGAQHAWTVVSNIWKRAKAR